MSNKKASAKSKIMRSPNRAHYDKATLNDVLDAGYLCHVSYLFEGAPVIIPTAYARQGTIIYIHGAAKNRMMNSINKQQQVCIAVTHLDGIVLARSAFHHSFNYRSAVVFGTPKKISDAQEKTMALKLITENILPGRWQEVREPSAKEIEITQVIAITIDEASVKIRSGAPIDDEADYDLPVWAGELPIKQYFQKPITDNRLTQELPVPKSVNKALKIKE